MDQLRPFCYRPGCSSPGCNLTAVYKIAASWSDGTSRELKNYGLACESHGASQLTAAQTRHQALKRSDGESVGAVAVYVLRAGCRDIELIGLAVASGDPDQVSGQFDDLCQGLIDATRDKSFVGNPPPS